MGSRVLQETCHLTLLLHQELQLESLLLKEKSILFCDNTGFSGPKLISDCKKKKKKNGCRILSPKDQRDHPDFSSVTDAKTHLCHGMGVQQSKWHG